MASKTRSAVEFCLEAICFLKKISIRFPSLLNEAPGEVLKSKSGFLHYSQYPLIIQNAISMQKPLSALGRPAKMQIARLEIRIWKFIKTFKQEA